MALALAGATLCALVATVVDASVEATSAGLHVVLVAYRPYGFHAAAYAEVRDSMNEEARRVFGESGYVGYTAYGSFPVPLVVPDASLGCEVAYPAVLTVASIQWPYWKGEATRLGEEEAASKWARREGRIFSHEYTHLQIARFADNRILEALRDLPRMGCGELFERLEVEYLDIWNARESTQDTFDRRGDYRGAISHVPDFWREVNGPR